MPQFNRVRWDTLAMANARKSASPFPIKPMKTIDTLAIEGKAAIQALLDRIVTHMNALDKDGLEVNFNIGKSMDASGMPGGFVVAGLFLTRKY